MKLTPKKEFYKFFLRTYRQSKFFSVSISNETLHLIGLSVEKLSIASPDWLVIWLTGKHRLYMITCPIKSLTAEKLTLDDEL